MVGGFDAVEVCCETVVACVELEVCDCVVSGFMLIVSEVWVLKKRDEQSLKAAQNEIFETLTGNYKIR
jgi:hypothetical protein